MFNFNLKKENDIFWRFSNIPAIEESTFNRVLEKFFDLGISGLVRENIQNSLDGKIQNVTDPVEVIIKTGSVNREFIPGVEEINSRIICLEGRNNYTKEAIKHMKESMNEKIVSYISFEDFNTKGLKGAENGQSDSKEDTWSIYAYNKGVHSEEDNEALEKLRGGSHGIGKIASNAASNLNVMFFANCDEHGNKHLGGTVQLIEHKYNNEFYRSTGYFTDIKKVDNNKMKFYPFKNKFNEIFEKNTRGLKIVIPFLRAQFNDEREIIKSVCDSFFIAILEGKLKVIVNEKVLDSNTIIEYITNNEYYTQELNDIKTEFTPVYLNTYLNIKPEVIEIKDLNNIYKFNLYFNYNEEITKGRVAVIRTIGMKIEDKKVKNNVNKPFNAILIPNSITEDAFLKSLENESHTELSFDHIKDPKIQNNAKRFINNISKEIASIIEREVKKNNPTEGIMDTQDVLYLVDNSFKKDLNKVMSTVKLNKKNKDKVVKVKTDKPKKTKETREGGERNPDKLKKVRKRENETEDLSGKEERYNIHPDIVERIVIANKEIVKFDFSESKEVKKADKCDIALAVVDGMGIEYSNEFQMIDNYESIVDNSTGDNCKIKNNKITDVKIKDGIAQIELKLREKYNKALKFVYYVEV